MKGRGIGRSSFQGSAPSSMTPAERGYYSVPSTKHVLEYTNDNNSNKLVLIVKL